MAGIDSKHPSKMKTTLYNKKDFMTDEEINKALEARKPEQKKVVKTQVKGAGFIEDDDSDSSATDDGETASPKSKKSRR